jgi:hypothetical protein
MVKDNIFEERLDIQEETSKEESDDKQLKQNIKNKLVSKKDEQSEDEFLR